jgi:hypothetical protein
MLEIKRKEELLNNYLYKLSNKINKNNYENKNKIILKYIQEYNNKGMTHVESLLATDPEK